MSKTKDLAAIYKSTIPATSDWMRFSQVVATLSDAKLRLQHRKWYVASR